MNALSGYSVRIDKKKCAFHGTCADICPVGAMKVDKVKKTITYNREACIGCELCVEHCPEKALTFYRDNAKPVPLDIEIVKKEFVTPN